jgi:hypothetical protein
MRERSIIKYHFPNEPFPDGPPTKPEHIEVLTWGFNAHHDDILGAVDNLVAYLLVSIKAGPTRRLRPLLLPSQFDLTSRADQATRKEVIKLSIYLQENNKREVWRNKLIPFLLYDAPPAQDARNYVQSILPRIQGSGSKAILEMNELIWYDCVLASMVSI